MREVPMQAALREIARKAKDRRFMLYFAASLAALAVDAASFLALLRLGFGAAGSSVLAYGLGIGFHWLMSSRAVFLDRVAMGGHQRTRQKALFVLSALVGMAITVSIVGGIERLGGDPRLAKGVAIGASFFATYWLRKRVVFPGAADGVAV
ncbi:GtrA family protein [Aurantiacibacter flavus]|uniref:GtrA family protein n=1 Tax=Aurantiacibacter flavus TaxID=3145232 RepID=A0ABV0CZS7_9SPHN